jgi:Cu-processing system ATP-binding protein
MTAAVPGVPIVELAGLSKRFGRNTVLDRLDLAIPEGAVTAVVGPNAAGKTTLLKCLLGLVHPDEGVVRVEGLPVAGRYDYRRTIGYMAQGAAFPENLSGREVLRLVSGLRGNPAAQDDELVHRFQLAPELEKPVRTLSGGTRQKLNAVIAFLFRPRLLILDEPTAGLDPVANGILKEKIRAAVAGGGSVMLTSHVMAEIEELADTVVFLVEGRVHFHGTLAALREMTGEQRLERAVARLMRARAA